MERLNFSIICHKTHTSQTSGRRPRARDEPTNRELNPARFGSALPFQIISTMMVFLLLLGVLCWTIHSFELRPAVRSSTATKTCLYSSEADENVAAAVAADAELLETLDDTFEYDGRMQSAIRSQDFRCGFVSIIGAPNMGKSTLLNSLLQEDLCITTARPQTTRHAILGILSTNTTQVCLVDTPGIIDTPAYKLQEGMMEAVFGALQDADVLLVVTDVFSTPIPDDKLFARVQRSQKPVIVVVNKIDLAAVVNVSSEANRDKLSVTPEQAIAVWRQLLPNALAILPASASAGPDDPGVVALRRMLTGGPDLPAALRGLGRPIAGMFPKDVKSLSDEQAQLMLPISPPLYDQEILTDRTERFVASEMIRAAIFECLRKELPYCCEVQVTEFKEPVPGGQKKPVIRIAAIVFVERDSQKVIVIGKNGEQIKKVGVLAREKLEDFLQSQVRALCTRRLVCGIFFAPTNTFYVM